MCGLVGIVALQGPVDSRFLGEMLDLLAHRGPDGRGVVRLDMNGQTMDTDAPALAAMGHTRLAVRDLSPAGSQPMFGEDGSVLLALNGEIYNYDDLRRRLERAGHLFKSRSDAETALHAYEEWGQAGLDMLEGMYGLALWDTKRQRLVLARDRLGIKPLYYFVDDKAILFASEIKALLPWPDLLVEMDEAALHEYLTHTYPVFDRTWFKGVRSLMPGQRLIMDQGHIRLSGRSRFEPHGHDTPADFDDRLRSALETSVIRHLAADVPLGAHLSGGLDSSAVVALCRPALDRLDTFSARFDEGQDYDESAYVAAMRDRYPIDHHFVTPDAKGLAADFKGLIRCLDMPQAGWGLYPQYRVAASVRRAGLKVVLTGHGGDELWGGYPWLRPEMRLEVAAKRRARHDDLALMFPGFEPGQEREAHIDAAPDELTGVLTWDVDHYLPALLTVEDRMSMAHGVESRVPLLDKALVELAAMLPVAARISNGWLKAPLRKALAGVLPEKVTTRTDKMGLPTPWGLWLRGVLKPWAKEILSAPRTRQRGLMDCDAALGLMAEHGRGIDHAPALWQAINVEMWRRVFVDGDRP